MPTENDSTFMRITNKDIYEKLIDIEKHVVTTNGKVKRATLYATGAMALCIILLGFLFNHLASG